MTRTAVLSPALSKEIRALLPLWGASIAALAAAFAWRDGHRFLLPGPKVALFAYVVGSLAIGAQSVGQEYTYRTLPMLLSHPADRRRVYLLKFVVAAVMLMTLAAFAATTFAKVWRPESARFAVVILPVLCGLFLAPLLTMIGRSTLAGMILGGTAMALTWFATLAIAWFGFGIDTEATENMILGRWTLGMTVVCPVVGLLGWRRFRELEATDVASPALHLPRWLTSAHGARRHHPLRALAVKEVHVQQMAFVITGLHVIGWVIGVLLQRYVPSMATFPVGVVLLLYCMGLATVIGALASAEERQHGTLDWQLLQPSPAWQQWMVKVGVAFGLALLFGVGLPVLLNQLTPEGGFRTIRLSADLTVLIVLLTATSIYISSLSSSGVRAIVLSLPIGMAVAYFVQMASGALRWVTLQLAGRSMADIVTGAVTPLSVDPADVVIFAARGFSLTLAPLLLWFGFVNHTSPERTARRIFQQIVWIALLIVTGLILVGGVLALYERQHSVP
jgi:ABC-type transport system involved in multi-copper enzyme maturation permease subunit